MKRREVIAAGLAFAATNWPLTLPAQQASRLKRVGVLHPGPHAVLNTHGWRAFEHGLREEGFLEGHDFEFEHRFAEDLGHLSSMAAELVEANVAVILVRGPVPMQAAKVATATIPIVMAASSTDPVGEGLIASFARPGGNITGITYAVSAERFAKQLELLKESVGPISRVAVLWDLDAELYRRTWAPTLERAAGQLGLRILGPYEVRHVGDLDDAFTRMKEARGGVRLRGIGDCSQREANWGAWNPPPTPDHQRVQGIPPGRHLDQLRPEHSGNLSARCCLCREDPRRFQAK